jgi:probable HAF family extracellular repeat protein
MLSRVLKLLVVGMVLDLPPQVFAAYEIIDLGAATGGIESTARGINDSGQVVGEWIEIGSTHAFLWDRGQVTDLGMLGSGPTAVAFGINNSGQITGGSFDSAFLWENGVMSRLGTVGYQASVGKAINASGDVAGYASNTNQPSHSFIYHNGAMTEILAPTTGSVLAYGISDARQVVGTYAGASSLRAFIWQDGVTTDLISVFGEENGGVAWGVNNLGQAVGYSAVQGVGIRRATLWEGGSAIDLGVTGEARAINGRGQIVGTYRDDFGNGAFVYQDGTLTNLNTLLPENSGWLRLVDAYDINESGWIVGYGFLDGGVRPRAFLLTPEPATLAFVALAGLFFTRHRLKRA